MKKTLCILALSALSLTACQSTGESGSPTVQTGSLQEYIDYRYHDKDGHKAIAQAADGAWSARTARESLEDVVQAAYDSCHNWTYSAGKTCRVIKVDALEMNESSVESAVALARANRGGLATLDDTNPFERYLKLQLQYRYAGSKNIEPLLRHAESDGAVWEAAKFVASRLWNNGQYQEAEKFARLAVKRVEDTGNQSMNDQAWAYKTLGTALSYTGKYDEALEYLDRALELRPRYQAALGDKTWILRRAGRFDEALRASDLALAVKGGYAFAEVSRGYVHSAQGREQEALEAANRAWELADSNYRKAQVFALRSRVASRYGRYDNAIALIKEAQSISASVYHQAQHAYALLLSGKGQEALALLRELDEAENPEIMNELAFTLAEVGEDLDEAETLARRAASEGETGTKLNTLGYVLYKRGKLGEAEKYLRMAYEKKNRSDAFHAYSLGLVLDAKGDTQGAVTLWREALTKHPSVHTRARIEESLAKQTASLQ